MSYPIWIPPADKDAHAAKRQFVELYGSIAVMNTYLKIAVIGLVGVCAGLITLNVRTQQTFRNFKPLVIRVNETGRPQAMASTNLQYQPQEPEIKYFLIDFVQRYYSRMRATVRDNHTRALYFLEARLVDAIIEAERKKNTIESVLTGAGPEIDVNVRNVSIEDLRQPPYRATVDFEKVYYTSPDHLEQRRERYVANFVFVVKEHVPNALIPVNPLGLTITYFREDQAFE